MRWLRTLLSGKPHFVIGGSEAPYMLRWYLIPRNPWLNVYLHKFLRDDDDRALHDHPWWFVSLILKGAYTEFTEKGSIRRRIGDLAFRPARHRHRVVLDKWVDFFTSVWVTEPCWTLVVTGRKKRTWGFYCPKGFVPWYEFVDQNDTGNVGRGCE